MHRTRFLFEEDPQRQVRMMGVPTPSLGGTVTIEGASYAVTRVSAVYARRATGFDTDTTVWVRRLPLTMGLPVAAARSSVEPAAEPWVQRVPRAQFVVAGRDERVQFRVQVNSAPLPPVGADVELAGVHYVVATVDVDYDDVDAGGPRVNVRLVPRAGTS